MPLIDASQTPKEFHLRIHPFAKVFLYEEPGGIVHHFGTRQAHPSLEIVAEAVVETHLQNPFVGINFTDPDWSFYDQESTKQGYAEYLSPSPYIAFGDEVMSIAQGVRSNTNDAVFDFVSKLSKWIHDNLDYDPVATHVHSKLDEILQLKAGVCQDFAHLMIACCRMMGIPSRYVSGYLYCGHEEVLRGDHATHAWVDCLMPDGRWLALDPTNELLANDRYIRIHTGRDYSEVTPTRGVYVGLPASELTVSVRVDMVNLSATIS